MTAFLQKQDLTLNCLLNWLAVEPVHTDVPVTGIALDSRKVSQGDAFIAVPGIGSDGRDYIKAAISQGAVAVLAEAGRSLPAFGIPVVQVPALSEHVGLLANQVYGQPGQSVNIVGVTGTNGKSSTVYFLGALLDELAGGCGVMGTLGRGRIAAMNDMGNTTADILSCQAFAAEQRDQGLQWMAMEISSHGLEQGRVKGLPVDTAVFTNLTRDHLDYHKTMDAYAAAKARLFSQPGLKYAVINKDDEWSGLMLSSVSDTARVYTTSLADRTADVWLKDIELHAGGMSASITTPWGAGILNARLLGRFNLSNLLGVITVLGCHGFSMADILSAVARLKSVPGRMEVSGGNNQPTVIVDYAHTPDALVSALSAVREHGSGQVICVFGCGGDRDRGKRPLMTQAACAGADVVYLTSDNPRTEDPQQIIADALAGLDEVNRNKVHVIVDRTEAIQQAVARAACGDVVLVAGKGHECYQEINGVRYPFSDRDKVNQALCRREA